MARRTKLTTFQSLASFNQRDLEKIPRAIKKFFEKPAGYDGEVCQIANPGDLIPSGFRDFVVPLKCHWGDRPYLDDEGRARISFACQLAVGPIDGVIRIEAGQAEIPIYSVSSLDDVVTGQEYYQAIEFYLGTEDQEKSPTIFADKGAETPNYPGLAYVVFVGWKLWKWEDIGKVVPYLRAILLKNVEPWSSEPPDEYEEQEFPNSNIDSIICMAGWNNEIYYCNVTAGDNRVKSINLTTGIRTLYPTTSSIIMQSTDALQEFKGDIYQAKDDGIRKLVNGAGAWVDVLISGAGFAATRQLILTPDRTKMLYTYYLEGGSTTNLWVFDGTTHGLVGTVADWSGSNTTGIRTKVVADDNETVYLLSGQNIIKGTITPGLWTAVIGLPAGNSMYIWNSMVYWQGRIYVMAQQITPPETILYEITDGAIPSITAYPTGLGYRADSYDLEPFRDKLHLTIHEPGQSTDRLVKVFDRNLGTFTDLPAPASAGANFRKVLRYLNEAGDENNLYVGTNVGYFAQGPGA